MNDFLSELEIQNLTEGEKRYYRDLLKANNALRSPLDFGLYVAKDLQISKPFKPYPHTVWLNELLLALVEKRLYKSGPGPDSIVVDVSPQLPFGKRVHPITGEPVLHKLMTSFPPRIGKTMMVGILFTAWYIVTHPRETIMYISYGESLARSKSFQALQLIKQHPELGVAISDHSQSKIDWETVNGGGMIARGVGGVPTGRGGHLLIDDIIKDHEQASNPEQLDKIDEYYGGSLLPRVEQDNFVILNGTRWAFTDLHGRQQEKSPHDWYIVNVPAVSWEETNSDGISIDPETGEVDPLGRGPGEAICPELATVEYYEERKKASGYWYAAEYLGKPMLAEDAILPQPLDCRYLNGYYTLIHKDGTTETLPEKLFTRFATMDLAISEKQTADYTVLMVFDFRRIPVPEDIPADQLGFEHYTQLIVREIIRDRVPAWAHRDFILKHAQAWNAKVVGVEDVSFGKSLLQNLERFPIPINTVPLNREYGADKSKAARSQDAGLLLNAGNLFVTLGIPEYHSFKQELERFDGKGTTHDDMADCLSYGAIMTHSLPSKIWQPPKTKRTFEEFLEDKFIEMMKKDELNNHKRGN